MRAHRYWHRTSCLVSSSWMFSCPSTEIPCKRRGTTTSPPHQHTYVHLYVQGILYVPHYDWVSISEPCRSVTATKALCILYSTHSYIFPCMMDLFQIALDFHRPKLFANSWCRKCHVVGGKSADIPTFLLIYFLCWLKICEMDMNVHTAICLHMCIHITLCMYMYYPANFSILFLL